MVKDSNTININNLSTIETLDEFYKLTQPTASLAASLSDTLYGISHTDGTKVMPQSKTHQGYVFFTRPQLNMKSVNLRNLRWTYNLLDTNPNSLHRYVRNTLDPRLSALYNIHSSLVDNENGFIPLLTNTVKTVSGWPDIVLPTYTSSAGVRGEQHVIGDGTTDIFQAYDIDVTFKNIQDDPTLILFQTWIFYIAAVFEGIFVPYMDLRLANEIDYNTRIYRLVMDETQTRVKQISATGASFPISVPTGKVFDFTDDSVYDKNNKEINIRFKTVGAMYNDSILIHQFNRTSGMFDPNVKALLKAGCKESPTHPLVKIPSELANALNNRGHPIIDPVTYELSYWISKESETYKTVKQKLKGV